MLDRTHWPTTADRLAVPFNMATAESLLWHVIDAEVPSWPAHALLWDVKRQHGDAALSFAWDALHGAADPAELIARLEAVDAGGNVVQPDTRDAYLTELWVALDRPFDPAHDLLLIDAADRFRDDDSAWDAPPEILAALARLASVAAASDAAEEAQFQRQLDEQDRSEHEVIGEAEFERQAVAESRRCALAERSIPDDEFYTAIAEDMDLTPEQIEAAAADHKTKTRAWWRKYFKLFPESLESMATAIEVSVEKSAATGMPLPAGHGESMKWVFASENALKRGKRKRKAEPSAVIAGGVPLFGEGAPQPATGDVRLEDFWAYGPQNSFVYMPTRDFWPAAAVDARLGKRPSAAGLISQTRSIVQAVWCPGESEIIEGKLLVDGGMIERPCVRVLNLYRPPRLVPKAGDPGPWLQHVMRLYGADAEHIVGWLAHRVQRPAEKINHAIVLGGAPGIGKDTLLEPVKAAVGAWNFGEISPAHLLGDFNGYVRSVILRISEARDLGEIDRFKLHEHCKTLLAAPPDVLRCNEKYLKECAVQNVVGVIFTTNHRDGLYLPADDRRHFVTWSDLTQADFPDDYFSDLYQWLGTGGTEIVAHHLATLDLGRFDPKAPPRKTPAFWQMVDAGRSTEDADMADTIEKLGTPAALTLGQIATVAVDPAFRSFLVDRKNRRTIGHRLREAGYDALRNAAAQDGMWKVGGKRQVVYARRDLIENERLAAATALAAQSTVTPPPLPSRE